MTTRCQAELLPDRRRCQNDATGTDGYCDSCRENARKLEQWKEREDARLRAGARSSISRLKF